jgi:hypothetical protein
LLGPIEIFLLVVVGTMVFLLWRKRQSVAAFVAATLPWLLVAAVVIGVMLFAFMFTVRTEIRRGEIAEVQYSNHSPVEVPVAPRAPDIAPFAPQPAEAPPRAGAATAELPARAGIGPAWQDETLELYEADIYYSTSDAARALGKPVAAIIDQLMRAREQEEPTVIQITNTPRADMPQDEQLAERLASTLRKRWPDALVNVVDASAGVDSRSTDEQTVFVDLKRTIQQSRNLNAETMVRTGTLTATVQASSQALSASVSFSEKPWLDQYSIYASDLANQHDFVAYAPEFTSQPEEAKRAAEDAAVATLVDRLLADVSFSASATNISKEATARSIAKRHLSSLVADQFAQELQTPNGEVWRHATLVSCPSDQFNAMRSELLSTLQSHVIVMHRRERSLMLAGLILTCGIVAIVWTLNVVSRGYYKSPLVAVGIAAVVGVLMVVMFIS